MSQTKSSNLYNFDPDHVGGLIAAKDWSACWDYLGDVIENLTMSASPATAHFIMLLQKDMQDENRKKYVSDFGALLGELIVFLLTSPDTLLPDKNFFRLIFFHETLHTLFYIYDVDNTDDLIAPLLAAKKLSGSEQKKLLLLLSLNTGLDIVSALRKMDGEYRLAALASYFSYRKIFRDNVYRNKLRLYALRGEIEKASANPLVMMNLVTDYFHCSYLNSGDKHSLKQNINTAFRRFLDRRAGDFRKMATQTVDYGFTLDASRPTVLIIAEVFSKIHAMYRCWGERTGQIQNAFNVVFAMPKDKADPALKEDYANFAVFENIGDIVQLAINLKPDIIFMPSVGMRFHNVALSNMRLAPIQIMGLGHPATTMSDRIDYVMGPEYIYDPAAFPNDTYIADGYPGTYIPLLDKSSFFGPPRRDTESDGRLRVAIVGSDIKVSHPFFALLKEIVAESPFPVHVSFMMGVGGVDSLYIEKYLQENFADATYHGWQKYEDYIDTLKTADIVLNPFPFGHTNTIIDTLMCGKPCIGMDGVEPASKSEGDVLRSVGLEDEFVARSAEDYKAKFFALGKRILNGETRFFDPEKIYDRLFASAPTVDYDYGRVMRWIYDHDAALRQAKKSGRSFFRVFDEI